MGRKMLDEVSINRHHNNWSFSGIPFLGIYLVKLLPSTMWHQLVNKRKGICIQFLVKTTVRCIRGKVRPASSLTQLQAGASASKTNVPSTAAESVYHDLRNFNEKVRQEDILWMTLFLMGKIHISRFASRQPVQDIKRIYKLSDCGAQHGLPAEHSLLI